MRLRGYVCLFMGGIGNGKNWVLLWWAGPCPKTEVLVSLSPLEAYNQILLALKARFPGDSQSLCEIPRLGSLTWGSEPSQQWENFFGCGVLHSVATTQWAWDLYL